MTRPSLAMTYLGVPIELHGAVGSTNDEALRRADEGAAQGLVIVAEEQTAGRGRHGRSWWDRPGESLLFSVLLRPRIPLARFPLLAIAMACSVAEVGGNAARQSLSVKWPNDVMHEGRKLCGILAEARPQAGAHALVIGTGINVNQDAAAFPPELRDRATSLRAAAGGGALDRHALLASVLTRFDMHRGLAEREGADALRQALLPRLPAPGSRIVVQTSERRVEGTVEEILETGALLVRGADGERFPVVAGEIPFGTRDSA